MLGNLEGTWQTYINSFIRKLKYTLNLSLLNLEHVIYKQLQINRKYTFKFVFLFHVLILKAEKQLFPPFKLLFVIWIQVTVVFNFIYICSCRRYLWRSAQPPPPPHPRNVNITAAPSWIMKRRGQLSCIKSRHSDYPTSAVSYWTCFILVAIMLIWWRYVSCKSTLSSHLIFK
jgi:hypothetical protein